MPMDPPLTVCAYNNRFVRGVFTRFNRSEIARPRRDEGTCSAIVADNNERGSRPDIISLRGKRGGCRMVALFTAMVFCARGEKVNADDHRRGPKEILRVRGVFFFFLFFKVCN
jgi:hypothetical protein